MGCSWEVRGCWAPHGRLGTTTQVLVETIGYKNSQTWAQISGLTLTSWVTLDKTHFFSEVQKTGIIEVLYCLWIM